MPEMFDELQVCWKWGSEKDSVEMLEQNIQGQITEGLRSHDSRNRIITKATHFRGRPHKANFHEDL